MMMPSPTDKLLLIDSCVIEYWLNPDMHDPISKQLLAWTSDERELAISEISYAELINGAHKSKTTKVIELLDSYTKLEVSQQVLVGAGTIGTIYKTKENNFGLPSMADTILASTSFIYNLPVVTANIRDFPHPFFKVSDQVDLKYKKKDKNHYISLAKLTPNHQMLSYWHSQIKQ